MASGIGPSKELWIKVPLRSFLKSQQQKRSVTTIDIQHCPTLMPYLSALFNIGTDIRKITCGEVSGQEGVDLLNSLYRCPLLRSLTLRSLSPQTAPPLIALIDKLVALKITDAPNHALFMLQTGLINTSTLRYLSISYQNLQPQPAQRSPRGPIEVVTPPPLTLVPAQRSSRQTSEDVESKALQNILYQNKSICSIELVYVKFKIESFKLIAESLKNTMFITILKLNHCTFELGTEIILGQSIQINRSIIYLDLSSTSITEDGQIALAESLIFNQTLRHLNLTGSSLKQRSYNSFINTFEYNKTLIKLEFKFSTPRYEKGPDHLVALIKRNYENHITLNTKLVILLIKKLTDSLDEA